MNNLLELKGQFMHRKNQSAFGPLNLPKGSVVTEEHLHDLKEQLEGVLKTWVEDTTINGALVSVHYKTVIAKSNRIQILLSDTGKKPNDSVRGAKFVWEDTPKERKQKHVFTHFVSLEAIRKSIQMLDTAMVIVREDYGGQITEVNTADINAGKYNDRMMKKSTFLRVITDVNHVEFFAVDKATKPIKEESIITIYKTGVDTQRLFSKFGIKLTNGNMIDETTLRLNHEEIDLLQSNAAYLIAMSVVDFTKLLEEENKGLKIEEDKEERQIPSPQNEPIVGVIDTRFDEEVYFHDWVQYEDMLDESIDKEKDDYFHGTAVTSIIVDGPALNPSLEDNCGHFQVRHFGVATAIGFSSFAILKMIRDIVARNRDIKVWNLSLGSAMEIDPNFMSPESAELDRIQSEYDVIFVVAGTNKKLADGNKKMRIGTPADSLNSLVVNAVDFTGKSASYTRVGPVLSFFYKPDVSYYGGDADEKIAVYASKELTYVSGTSFAAPWITRKLAYLIYRMGFSREIAKALIIDAAAGWNPKDNTSYAMGYGIVPKKIEDLLCCRDDEIRFVIKGTIEEYETYTYQLPVPKDQDGHPFFARATLVYFPKSDRHQGVDYTSTEMDIHFGRLYEKNGRAAIKSIDKNTQADEGLQILYEENVRKFHRKWDNVKHISEVIKDRAKPRKVYNSGMWGLLIRTKERQEARAGQGLPFGVVVTLREMNGINRLDNFIQLCMMHGWIVNEYKPDVLQMVYEKAEEEIDFEDKKPRKDE
ncbi:MAG: S8 family peptidase [Bacteroides sp.]|nr:S8 family peptidase [Bacteroides sp.]MCM1549171.1 S8 family peptidase [Clostridium sp.]